MIHSSTCKSQSGTKRLQKRYRSAIATICRDYLQNALSTRRHWKGDEMMNMQSGLSSSNRRQSGVLRGASSGRRWRYLPAKYRLPTEATPNSERSLTNMGWCHIETRPRGKEPEELGNVQKCFDLGVKSKKPTQRI